MSVAGKSLGPAAKSKRAFSLFFLNLSCLARLAHPGGSRVGMMGSWGAKKKKTALRREREFPFLHHEFLLPRISLLFFFSFWVESGGIGVK